MAVQEPEVRSVFPREAEGMGCRQDVLISAHLTLITSGLWWGRLLHCLAFM